MPLQNRVTPTGEIIATPHRGLFTGNRGIIHDPATKTLLKRRWSTPMWLTCVLAFRGRRREVMAGRSWTELFFLDEATALAAGHRPCFFCRRDDARRFRSSWEQEWHALHHQAYQSPEQRQVALRDKWKEGISSFRIGYTALLDNLRPMLCTGVSGKVLKLAAEYLGNPAAARRSGVSPLRLLEVYQQLRRMDQGGAGMLSEALETGVLHSGWTRLGSEGKSLIAMDVSNSMKLPVYPGGKALRFDIAPLLAGLWKNKGYSVITGVIGNNWKPMEMADRPVLLATDQFRGREGEAGYGINAHLILQDLLRRRLTVDRILVFTDCRLWGSRGFNKPSGADLVESWRQYRNELAPNAKLYLFDLAGYGAHPLEIAGDEVFLIAGWKEPILEVLATMEGRRSAGAV